MKGFQNIFIYLLLLFPSFSFCQLHWQNVDSLYQPLPSSVHVYFTKDSLDGKPNIAYYLEAGLKDRKLDFTTQVGNGKRYTPSQYYDNEKHPLIVVNATFFEYVHNSSLNVVINKGRIIAYNNHSIPGRGVDTFTYRHPFISAIGISKKRKADVAWTYTDSSKPVVYATQLAVPFTKDSSVSYRFIKGNTNTSSPVVMRKWKMQTAVGGGPVLLQNEEVKITNNEELKFTGKAIEDKHPRTTMGYTKDGKLIILMFQGRFPGLAEGATLTQEATVLQSLGCWEAINLDGGGSSCLLVNGKETIKPSEKDGQRPVPSVFMIKVK